ncbi:hypothetical protein O3P69_003412 [Scylla paramamosain]|uniref:Uncharacterized protein n=1 Tax=Scylla paramamosain TaxID=85552 RepID=A0AAW0UM24_SCYPA
MECCKRIKDSINKWKKQDNEDYEEQAKKRSTEKRESQAKKRKGKSIEDHDSQAKKKKKQDKEDHDTQAKKKKKVQDNKEHDSQAEKRKRQGKEEHDTQTNKRKRQDKEEHDTHANKRKRQDKEEHDSQANKRKRQDKEEQDSQANKRKESVDFSDPDNTKKEKMGGEQPAQPSRPGVGYGALASLGWLYLVQGIPYGLQDKFLPVQLRSLGLNYSSVSLLKLLLVPWIAKGVWAPLVEVCGGKQCWLLIATLGLGASSLAGSAIAPDDVASLGVMLLSLNLCSAVQDVAVDGLALHLLPDDHLSIGNTLQVVLYKVGCLVGGAGLTYLLMCSNWTITFTSLAAVYMTTAAWYMSIASLCLLSFNSGVISTVTFTFMMVKSRECSPESQASHYSVLASVEVAGKLIFASLAGCMGSPALGSAHNFLSGT